MRAGVIHPTQNRFGMFKSIGIVLSMFALAGCATADRIDCEVVPKKSLAWDGLGHVPNEPARARRRLVKQKPSDTASSIPDDEIVLAAVPKYSKEWVALYETMRARDDVKLARALIICRGCFPADGDKPDSIK
jgi:hypothetical protein